MENIALLHVYVGTDFHIDSSPSAFSISDHIFLDGELYRKRGIH
jgi:hypothetical protein